ncbi:hypothetical protein HRI_000049300 [Hibiscus trionum]|uniref:HMA domain-containing protein n=1 Tax=Hibiscus trionum TaxID=183268 RepID=A0A9W7LHN1_HIBTR|nr:hypothetical protein HRI_000049300 [Hibiscus trionum]
MQQKIVIKVSMHSSKRRTEALQVAAAANGVTSVALHGPEKDKLVIVGDGVDAVCLTKALRKKLCHASIDIVEEVKDSPPCKKPVPELIIYCQPPQVEYYRVVPVPDPDPAPCTIM